jgi:succinylglutamate desuccinylase
MELKRIIGRHEGIEKGPLLICFGAMHGNEPAGVEALRLMIKMLEVEPITNPAFQFNGRLVAIRGNLQAIKENKRFIEKDLNRQWTKQNVDYVKQYDYKDLGSEEKELKAIIEVVENEIKDYQPEKVVVLDLHTTTAFGGIFSIATDDNESLRIAIELHAPVILGMLDGISGTSLHYFNNENFEPETVAVCFESGQHNENLSINRAIAAITNCLRTIGCVSAEHVENLHDNLLKEYSSGLPKVSELILTHSIKEGDNFEMYPNYKNFQKVVKGEVIAKDKNGDIIAPEDGLILMPLYQKQGDDGFFLIKENQSY